MLDMESLIEALLFVADGPVALEELAQTIGCDKDAIEQATQRLGEKLAGRGVRLVRVGSQVQMVTAPEAGPIVERFLGLDAPAKLSPAALETLAIIAYRQPITRAQIEEIRGANSEGVLRTLLARSLIAPVGRLDQVGRPVLFGTTFEFLHYFGLKSLDELPALPDPQP
jgi:segregation and condensation protein B